MIQQSQAVVFLDIYQAFITVEHPFLYKALECFDFVEFYFSRKKVIYTYQQQFNDLSQNLRQTSLNRLAVFLFVIVVELLYFHFLKLQNKGFVSLFEIRITQLADGTV